MSIHDQLKRHILSPICRLMRCNDSGQCPGTYRMPLNFSWVFVTNRIEKCLDICEQVFYNWRYRNERASYLDGKTTPLYTSFLLRKLNSHFIDSARARG